MKELREQGNFEFAGELEAMVKNMWPKVGGEGEREQTEMYDKELES